MINLEGRETLRRWAVEVLSMKEAQAAQQCRLVHGREIPGCQVSGYLTRSDLRRTRYHVPIIHRDLRLTTGERLNLCWWV